MDLYVTIQLNGKQLRASRRMAEDLSKGTLLYVKEYNDGHIEVTDKL